MSMVYDCFMFSNELDTLELRLKILNDLVDRYVIVEGTRTQNNKPKELVFNKNRERFEKWGNKIIHIIVDEWPEFDNEWTFEHFQRNCILRGLKECKDDDIIILCDVDEIPSPNVIKKAKRLLGKNKGVYHIGMFRYSFFYNYICYTRPYWYAHPKIFKYEEFMCCHNSFSSDYGQGGWDVSTTPDQMRCLKEYSKPLWGGWHFSSIGDVNRIRKKISTLAVADGYINSGLWEISNVADCIKKGRVPNRPQFKLCSTLCPAFLPDELLNEKEKYIDSGTITHLNKMNLITFMYTIAAIIIFRGIAFLRGIKNFLKLKGRKDTTHEYRH